MNTGNEQWLVAPKSDIGLYLSDIQVQLAYSDPKELADRVGSFDHNDPEFESLRKDFIEITLELSRSNLYRDDRRE